MRKGISITVTPADRVRLQSIIRDRNSPQKHVWRARIIVLTGDGEGTTAVMRAVGKGKTVVWRWQERFMHEGVEGLTRDKTRPSRIPPLPPETVDRVVALTNQAPPHAATHWTASVMAKAVGISPSSVRRIWKRHGLQPHRVRAFKLSNDPKFAEKLKDVVGLEACPRAGQRPDPGVDPPAHAVVLSIDEKSQIQALDRTQPGLPMKKGRCATMTHDYKRNGTTTLFAALDILDGKVIGRCMQRHRHQEFIRFLNAVEHEVPADKAVHVVLDNYTTHKHPKVTAWLKRHQRFTFHFTPTSCSWANAVEGWFAKLTRQRLKRGVFTSIVELQTAINRFIADANGKPKPFVWTKSSDAILAAVQRGRQALEAIH
jgi:transposase